MRLLDKAARKAIPRLGSTASMKAKDIRVPVKLFLPGSGWTWYVVDGSGFVGEEEEEVLLSDPRFDPEKDEAILFGFVVGLESELGQFALSELREIRAMGVFRVERDLYWSVMTLDRVMAMHER